VENEEHREGMHLVKELEETLSTDTAPVKFETTMSSPAAEPVSRTGIEKDA